MDNWNQEFRLKFLAMARPDYCVGGRTGGEKGHWRWGGEGANRPGGLRSNLQRAAVIQARILEVILEPSFSLFPMCKFIKILPSCFLFLSHSLHDHHLWPVSLSSGVTAHLVSLAPSFPLHSFSTQASGWWPLTRDPHNNDLVDTTQAWHPSKVLQELGVPSLAFYSGRQSCLEVPTHLLIPSPSPVFGQFWLTHCRLKFSDKPFLHPWSCQVHSPLFLTRQSLQYKAPCLGEHFCITLEMCVSVSALSRP